MQIENISVNPRRIKVTGIAYGEPFVYFVKSHDSRRPGELGLFLDLPDVNGKPMMCDVYSSQTGSFE